MHDAIAASAPTVAPRFRGALALELAPGSDGGRVALSQTDAGTLADRIAQDLATMEPEAAALELVSVGAHYDAVEILRPGWPLHRELSRLAMCAPAVRGERGRRIVMFGSHAGALSAGLTPEPQHLGGALRLLPFVLDGDPDIAARVGNAFEQDMIERGMAGAATALCVQEVFALRIEHARYLTVHDLAAMMALQYEHAGLAALWPLIETALLAPQSERWLDAPPEPLVHYAQGKARIALFAPMAWRARYASDTAINCARLEQRFEQFQARERQIAAVLEAHGIPVTFVHCDASQAPEL